MNQDWTALHDAFMAISRVNADCSKSGDGTFIIKFHPTNYWEDEQKKVNPYILLEFGGYQIGDWRRHEEIGPFKTLDEAWDAARDKVREAYNIVNGKLAEDGKNPLSYPPILL